ncbi:MAG: hypothetical protein RL173_1695 [Fibrobacterota bacterium]|jgi:hypothetical protein
MAINFRVLHALFTFVLGGALSGCLSGVVDPVPSALGTDPLVGAWRSSDTGVGFQYRFLDSSRMVVQRPMLATEGDTLPQIDTLPIAFEPGGFFFQWRYKGEIGRQYCFRKGDTLIMGVAAMGEHQQILSRLPTSGRTKDNAVFGMWESILCPSIYCLLDTVVIDTNGYLRSKIEQNKFGTVPFPVEFQDETMSVLVPEQQQKYAFVHMVRNDSLWLLETGVSCPAEVGSCVPNSRLKLVKN